MHDPVPHPPNQLAHQTSPYLLQHAHNPVDWHPWGDEAFALSTEQNKPVFLSVGYSTCHWCHVMAHESFENNAVAAILNAHFVCIKVDREELPDIDAQYMLATQAYYALSGNPRGGGWPNSIWLMPDGRPFFAGTYFPRQQFIMLLQHLHQLWTNQPAQIEHNAQVLTQYMHQLATLDSQTDATLHPGLIDKAIAFITRRFDPERGGFGGAPKFPPHGNLALLTARYRRTQDDALLHMITATLDAMMRGGIYDHIGGGFHRYATDARWFCPHFEKMLYDNAQLITAYADGFALTGNARYRHIVAETFDWLEREMIDANSGVGGGGGGFYSAIDADSEGEEGKFYVWHIDEIRRHLGDDADLFIHTYGIEPGGNWTDEATGHQPGTNIPFLTSDVPTDQHERFAAMRQTLRQHRDQRIRPHLDDKVLTSWNGLMITALAYAGRLLDEPRYTQAAARAATFILDNMRQPDGQLFRVHRNGQTQQPGYLDDYAHLTDGLIALYEATHDKRWLDEACSVVKVMRDRFADPIDGGFFYTATEHDAKIMRSKNPASGGNMPNPNGVAAWVLMRLGQITGDADYTLAGYRTLTAFALLMQAQSFAADDLILVTDLYLNDATLQQHVTEASAATTTPPPPVTTQVTAPSIARPGQTIDVTVRVDIASPYHIYGPQVAGSGLSPTQLVLADDKATLAGVTYPPPTNMAHATQQPSPMIYTGSVIFTAHITLPPDATETLSLLLQLHAQPCHDRACLQPLKLDLPLSITIDAAAAP